MQILNSTIEDIDVIFKLYNMATTYQKIKSAVPWPEFDRAMVVKEIKEQRQWKIVIDNEIACVWAIAYSDPEIWPDRNDDAAIYIHRISTHADFRGRNLVKEIVEWAKKHALAHEKQYVRMDTVGNNTGLINHYKKCGFDFLGLSKLKNTDSLPDHYHNATVSLFQITV